MWPLNLCISSPRRAFPFPAYVSFAVAHKNHWFIDLANLHDTRGHHYIHHDVQAFHLLYSNSTMSHNKTVSCYNVVQPDKNGKVPGIVALFHVQLDDCRHIILPGGNMTCNSAEVVIDRPTPMPAWPAFPTAAPPPLPQQSQNHLVAGLITSQQAARNQLGLPAQAMTDMTCTVTSASSACSIVNSVCKPLQPFKEQRGPDVWRFLTAFWVWAPQQLQLQDYERWLACVFSYLHDNSAIWVTSYLEQQKRGETPFNGSWTKIEEVFIAVCTQLGPKRKFTNFLLRDFPPVSH
jgi:hypothetical protein